MREYERENDDKREISECGKRIDRSGGQLECVGGWYEGGRMGEWAGGRAGG